MKKLITILTLLALMGLSKMNVTAQSDTTGTLTWELIDSTLTISGSGAMPNYSAYSSPWYSYRDAINTVIIGDSVTSIGDWAFYNCSYLTSITIPNSVTSIGDRAFHSCSNLTSITIPNDVTSIGNRAFFSCSNLTSITIPNNVTSIGDWAFFECSRLDTVHFNAINCIKMGNSMAVFYTIKTLNIGDNVKMIPNAAFFSCSQLTSITIPNSVTSIGNFAFQNCSGLTFITIPNSVTSIGVGAFQSCSSLTFITIPNSVTSIGSSAFSDCSGLISFTIPNSVTSIENFAFAGCSSLTFITIPNSVTSIGDRAFQSCSSLTSITIPNSVTSIGIQAFSGCSGLTSITIPNSVTSIGMQVFVSCSSLTSITIPNSVTSIGNSAFSGCSGLTSITIPNSVTSIGMQAFSGCSGLTSITTHATTPPILFPTAFSSALLVIPVYIPCHSYNSYSTASGWNMFTNLVVDGPADTTFYTAVICHNVPYTDQNFIAPITDSGTYYTQLAGAHCNSVACLVLTEYPDIPITNYSANFCEGTFYSDQNFTDITQAGSYDITLQNINGCDSVVRLHLAYNEPDTLVSMKSNAATVSIAVEWTPSTAVVKANGVALTNDFNTFDTIPVNEDSMVFITTENNAQLTVLRCSRNQLTALDVTNNTALTGLECYNNQLTELDVTNNTALTGIACNDNQLTALDVTNNTALTMLIFHRNQLTELDVTNNTALTVLECSYNQLTELDVAKNTVLTELHCSNNQLTALDIANNTELTMLYAHGQQIKVPVLEGETTFANPIFYKTPAGEQPVTIASVAYAYQAEVTIIGDTMAFTTALPAGTTGNAFAGTITVVTGTSISHHTQPNITIYPNPTSGELRIESGELGELRMENGELRMGSVEVFDIMGRKQHAEIRESDGGVLLNITHLPSGIYLVKAEGRVWKVVKQ